MIVRAWRGWAPVGREGGYERHATATVFPSLRALAGHRGALLLKRLDGEEVELTVLTLWESREAIRQFAGDAIERAIVEPAARAVLSRYDTVATHHEVVEIASRAIAPLSRVS